MELAPAANGVSGICKTLQASEFWMQYKQPILSLFGCGCGFQEMVTSSIILKIYIDPWPRAGFEEKVKKLLIVSAVRGSL